MGKYNARYEWALCGLQIIQSMCYPALCGFFLDPKGIYSAFKVNN